VISAKSRYSEPRPDAAHVSHNVREDIGVRSNNGWDGTSSLILGIERLIRRSCDGNRPEVSSIKQMVLTAGFAINAAFSPSSTTAYVH
jgi:hypothetical protein